MLELGYIVEPFLEFLVDPAQLWRLEPTIDLLNFIPRFSRFQVGVVHPDPLPVKASTLLGILTL